jgi:class 3 adenylate cyclase
VVDAALAPMRAKMIALQAQAVPPEAKRKQVTVLFADVSGFTAMSETLDAEEVTEFMNALWERLDASITAHGGQIDKHIGDCVMGVWGTVTVREDDPERAVRAALEMQAALAEFREARGAQLALRIGLNTGPVLLSEVGSTREFTAMGDTVNLASRMEHAAPVDGILISHDTYRHIRGVFDVLPRAPLAVKGKAEPVQTYIVQRAKSRAFHMGTRGVEGIETRMIGREAEMLALQNAYDMNSRIGSSCVRSRFIYSRAAPRLRYKAFPIASCAICSLTVSTSWRVTAPLRRWKSSAPEWPVFCRPIGPTWWGIGSVLISRPARRCRS